MVPVLRVALPVHRSRFGSYLVEKGVITLEQYQYALAQQNKDRLLGKIAIEEKYLSEKEVEKIIAYVQTRPQLRFGEAAVALGYLTAGQLRFLLDIRVARKPRLGEILIANGFLTRNTLNEELAAYNAKRRRLKKILVCEPSSAIRRLLCLILGKQGYETVAAATGKEALALAKAAPPDIIITANILPDMNGYDLCRALLENPATARIQSILLSSSITDEIIETAFEAGVTYFLRKPVQEAELTNVIIQIEKVEFEKRPEKILIVDDSAGARMASYRELSGAFGTIMMAENGLEGLELARREWPDLVVMDVEMPVMGGLEACRLMKDDPATENIPVVFVSSHDSLEFRHQGFEAGAVEYFGKPFRPGALRSFVTMLFESSKIVKEEKILVVDDSPTSRTSSATC